MICPPNVSGRRIAGIHKDTAHRSTESACVGVKVMCNVGVEIPELQGGTGCITRGQRSCLENLKI